MAELTLREFLARIYEQRGLDLRGYKCTSLDRRIRKRMLQVNLPTLDAYFDRTQEDGEELTALLNTVLINVTEFFRDPQAWEIMRHDVLPGIVKHLRPGDQLRCWSAGCATGEEPYSLAILLAEVLGPRAATIDVRVYGTDIDEDALTRARQGEYSAERLRRVSPEWRARYFAEVPGGFRLKREIRRTVVFGRSNLLTNAPISHCDVIVCRNLLIYLDGATQNQVLRKVHYALESGGVLFLGKSESRIAASESFQPLHAKWRIFQKRGASLRGAVEDVLMRQSEAQSGEVLPNADESKLQKDFRQLKLYQHYLFETLKSGVIVLDGNDVIADCNGAVQTIWGVEAKMLIGRRLQATELVQLCPDLSLQLETAKGLGDLQFTCRVPASPEDRIVSVMVRSVTNEEGGRIGALLYGEDVTYHHQLQVAVRQLQTTSAEVQSVNEELETTNEELQSANEELETTNEELQSTNEELETTNEELQSTNEELEARTGDLNVLTSRYVETLRQMPWPVMVLDAEERVDVWNTAAQRLLGLSGNSIAGVRLEQLPMLPASLKRLLKYARWAVTHRKSHVLRNETFAPAGVTRTFDVHFTPLLRGESSPEGVLIMFGAAELPQKTKRQPGPVS